MITDLVVIFIAIAIVFTVGYYTRVFIARNDRDMENLTLRDTNHRLQARIDTLKKEAAEASKTYETLDRSYQQLESNCTATVHAYAKCETDLIVTTGRLTVACDELLAYGVDIRADWAEQQEHDERQQPEHVEEFPSLFIKVANDQKEQHPERAGDTLTWHMPLTPEQEEELQKALPPVEAWDAWTTYNPTVPALEGRVHVPAQRDGGKS